MDKTDIIRAAQRMETKRDLLALLNRMKWDEMGEAGMSDLYYPFTMKHINYYCNPNNDYRRYRQFEIKKKSGGYRQITAPRYQSFMLILRYVNEIFKVLYTPSEYAMGFTEGRSVVTNAELHKGQNYILNIDLKDFFPSIDQARVWKRIQLKPLNIKRPMANILAGMCSMKTEEDGTLRYVLPQGAPTSPIITNMICDTLDRRLAGLAKRFRLRYSRYADDITFSSMHNVYQPKGEFWHELRRIIGSQGFQINEDKTRLQKAGSRQEVTGIIVSDKLNVTQKYVRDIRNILYIWDRYGYSAAYNKFYPKYKSEKGHVKKSNPDMVNVLEGKLMYLRMVKGGTDSVYVRLKAKFDGLVLTLNDLSNTTKHGITYIETMPLKEFEKNNSTEVSIVTTTPTVKSPKPHCYGSFVLGGIEQFASVSRYIEPEVKTKKEFLSISLCSNSQGELFWLIHKLNKVTIPQ